jgi:DNA-binding transcriptional MerR regulator/methylmalonyl-CoA mutase cobalamin-binding subunit
MTGARYRIGAASRLSGLSTHVIRIWERRYQALQPDRSGGGARLYSDTEIERLRLLRQAVERGHAISQVATLADEELARLSGGTPSRAEDPTSETSAEETAQALVAAVGAFDLEGAERVLERAALSFSPRALVMDVLAPILKLVGSAWARGDLCVASEHLATVLVRDRAGALLRGCSPEPHAETIVLTTPAGEQHELGALLAAVTVAMNGFRAAYLGGNLPASEIAVAARRTGASAVALSLVSLSVAESVAELARLQRVLPADTRLLLGGANAARVAAELDGPVEVHASLAHLERWLSERKARARVRAP